MSASTESTYAHLMQRAAELADLGSAEGLLGWDQETKMPRKGADGRAHVSATLAGVVHEKLIDPALLDGLQQLHGNGLGETERAQIAELHRVVDRQKRIPGDLVRAVAEIQSRATSVWVDCRPRNDFKTFAPLLEEVVRLKRRVAEAVGFEDDPYDALLDEYEPGAKVDRIAAVLSELREFLVPVVQEIADRNVPRPDLLDGPFDREKQDAFGRQVVEAMGFDLEAGRLDLSAHPFTSGIHAGDTRLTTRYAANLATGLFGTMHEAGHGLYEQNLPERFRRTPLGSAASLGIHESQSRLWENMVGRGRAMWAHFFPRLQEQFPERLKDVDLDTFHRAVNDVRRSLIRIESDEVTYNLHIVVRFELERALISGDLPVADLPGAWNEKFNEYLGITPPDLSSGVMQDIHWAAGLIGYFPTYSLGNLYAAQLYDAAVRGVPALEDHIARGNLIPLRDWLVEHVHRWGRLHGADDLVTRATGGPLDLEYFKRYVRAKFGPLYNLS